MKKIISIILYSGLFLALEVQAQKRCLNIEGLFLNKTSDEGTIEEFAKIKESIKKYFSIKGEESISTELSWDEASELARFLYHEGFDIKIFDEEELWRIRDALEPASSGIVFFVGSVISFLFARSIGINHKNIHWLKKTFLKTGFIAGAIIIFYAKSFEESFSHSSCKLSLIDGMSFPGEVVGKK